MPSPSGSRDRPDRASRLIEAFRAHFGPAHELFACHAAFPAVLTPELTYQLWAAFRADVHRKPMGVPWIAAADLLLSSLCAEIGGELYEMAPDVRAVLRRRLMGNPRLGSRRVEELSNFLLGIAAAGQHADDAYERTLAQAQRVTALAHSAPERAAAMIARMLAEIDADDHFAWMRVASLLQGLADPLAGFPALVQLAPAMAARGRGEPGLLEAFVDTHGPAIEVQGVRLVVPVPPVLAPPELTSPRPKTELGEGPRGLRVLVAGAGRPPSEDVASWAAQEVEQALAAAGHARLAGDPSGEALRRCDAVVVIGGDERVEELAMVAERQGKPVLPLPWTGGAARRVAEILWQRPQGPDAPLMTQVRARRLLDGSPRLRSDASFLTERLLSVLALQDPAAERAYRDFSRSMAHLLGSLEWRAAEEPTALGAFRSELLAAAGASRLDIAAEPAAAIREIEATLPAMVHWLVADFMRAAKEHAGDALLDLLAPLLARHAHRLAPAVIGRALDDGEELHPWFLRWMQETKRLLVPEEHQRWVQEIAIRGIEGCLALHSWAQPDRIAAISSFLRLSELLPHPAPLRPLLSDSRAAARNTGYLVCSLFHLRVSANVLDACLRLEQRELEEHGSAPALRHLLRCYELVPGLEHGPEARLAAASLSRTMQLLDAHERVDPEGSHRLQIRVLLDVRFNKARTLLDRLDAAARRYEALRREMPRGDERTARMEEGFEALRKLLHGVTLTAGEIQARFDAGGDGDRIAALASIVGNPGPASFEPVRQCIDTPRSSFEQYWALRIALRMVWSLEPRSREALQAALERQMSGASGTRLQGAGAAHRQAAERLLSTLRGLLGEEAGQPPQGSAPDPALRDMVLIPSGRFWMGSDPGEPLSHARERPRHEVELSAFEIGRTPVTQLLYREVMGANPSSRQGDDLPVIDVSWMDAVRFCNALSKREGRTPAYRIERSAVHWEVTANGYRLPTEAEWEYAARGWDDRMYPWGHEPPAEQLCWRRGGRDLDGDRRHGPCPVGSHPLGASSSGLLDMAGNVWEWCWDWYGPYEEGAASQQNPSGRAEGTARVVRGGSWISEDPAAVRAASRGWFAPSWRHSGVGFRCARGPIQKESSGAPNRSSA